MTGENFFEAPSEEFLKRASKQDLIDLILHQREEIQERKKEIETL